MKKVPEGLVSSARTTIAQLYFQLEDYPRTVSAVNEILKIKQRLDPIYTS